MQPFLSVSQVSVLCIVYNVPAVFVLILLGDFLYIVVYIQNIFDIVPFHCQSCPAAVYFYILNISYLYVRSLKCSGTIFKWVSGSQRLLHNMFKRKFHCFMTLAEGWVFLLPSSRSLPLPSF